MGSAFNNFLSNDGRGLNFKSYAHATGLYVDSNFARAPKFGFLYFVEFNIYPWVVLDQRWLQSNGPYDLGMLVKKIDMPRFKISTETINQYNRKTNIQTKLTYEPVSVEFHDDNSEITTSLWKNYYKYYYVDSNYGDVSKNPPAYTDSKYSPGNNYYGLNNYQSEPYFFSSIDIYVLHGGSFNQIRLVNPMITSWEHDQLDQATGNKILQNKMSLAYENVFYYTGKIVKGSSPGKFASQYYDNAPGALQVGTNVDQQVAQQEIIQKWEPSPKPVPTFTSPTSPFSNSQLNKARAQAAPPYASPRPIGSASPARAQPIPVYASPRPLGSASEGLRSGQRPGGFSIAGLNLWYGRGGLHGRAVINAGPLRLVLKK